MGRDDDKMTDDALIHALARFLVAEHFIFGAPPISKELAQFVGYTQRVEAAVVNELLARGWLFFPAAGQKSVTARGRARIAAAICTAKALAEQPAGTPTEPSNTTRLREVTWDSLTMKQIADMRASSTGRLRADCIRAESGRDTLSLMPTLKRIAAAINARTKEGR